MSSPRPQERKSGFPILALGVVAIVLGTASVLSRHFFEQRTPEMPAGLTPAPPGPAPAPGQFRVSALQGQVEAMQNGQWYVVRAGHLLSSKDVIRTHGGSRAFLRRGSIEVELPENMDLRLDALERETASLGLLRGGRVAANVGRDDEHLEITARETRTRSMGAARFVVSMTATGQVSVAASEGATRFEAQGKAVVVGKGQESTAQPGKAPSDPEAIPEELLLSVIWPDDDRVDSEAQLRGKTRGSTRVHINGTDTPVAEDGSFTAPIPLKIGPNRIKVDVEDIGGRRRSVDKIVRRSAPPPSLQAVDKELWNQ
jgi:hypothetical protein